MAEGVGRETVLVTGTVVGVAVVIVVLIDLGAEDANNLDLKGNWRAVLKCRRGGIEVQWMARG